MPDIERIEVISGPGATLWGANAVNGVINIITRRAPRPQGTLAYARRRQRRARRGAALRRRAPGLGRLPRLRRSTTATDGARTDSGAEIGDDMRRVAAGGVRADWTTARAEHFTLQGDAYRGDVDHGAAARVLGRATCAAAGRATSAPARTSRCRRTSSARTASTRRASRRRSTPRRRRPAHAAPVRDHVVVWGGGLSPCARRRDELAAQAFMPAERTLDWANLFAQDEIALAPDARAHARRQGREQPVHRHRVAAERCGSAWKVRQRRARSGPRSRARCARPRASTASRTSRAIRRTCSSANDTFESEIANVAELGYRAQRVRGALVLGDRFPPGLPEPAQRRARRAPAASVFRNDIEGRVTGLEAWAGWRVQPDVATHRRASWCRTSTSP